MQEVAEKLKNWEYAAMKKEIAKKKTNEDRKNSTQHDQESRTGVYSSTILTYWAVMTYLRSSSSSHYLEFEKA